MQLILKFNHNPLVILPEWNVFHIANIVRTLTPDHLPHSFLLLPEIEIHVLPTTTTCILCLLRNNFMVLFSRSI